MAASSGGSKLGGSHRRQGPCRPGCAPLLGLGLLLVAPSTGGEIIDRIAVTVGDELITASEIREEIRVAAFLNGQEPDFSPASRRRTAERLVERVLIKRDMELTRFPRPEASEADEMMRQVPQARLREMERYGISAAQLRAHLLERAALLRYIDFRFKLEIQLSEFEIRDYYEKRVLPELRKRGVQAPPSYDEARSEAEEALLAERVDQAVDRWLKEVRDRTPIRYREAAFQ